MHYEFRKVFSFLDYVMGGLQLNCTVAIDFTGKDGLLSSIWLCTLLWLIHITKLSKQMPILYVNLSVTSSRKRKVMRYKWRDDGRQTFVEL
jgi:hypothetical protein